MNHERFLELLEAFRDGRASDAELSEMTVMLRSDAALRREFVEEMLLEGCLSDGSGRGERLDLGEDLDSFSDVFSGRIALRRPGTARRPRARWVMAAAAALALAVGGALLVSSRDDQAPAPGFGVASGEIRVDGRGVSRIEDGREFQVAEETTVGLRPAEGVAVELFGGTTGSLRGSRPGETPVVELAAGGLTAFVGNGRPFRVQTVHARAATAGAGFSVRVESAPDGSTRTVVSVTEGRVRVESGGKARNMTGGQVETFTEPVRAEP